MKARSVQSPSALRAFVMHNVAMSNYPGQGTVPCKGITNGGHRCTTMEIEGLEYCLQHMPDDLLEEAESVIGFYRCRHEFGTPGACRNYAVEGTDPPRCGNHGGVNAGNKSKGAALRAIDGQAAEQAARIIAIHGGRLAQAQPVEDPYAELMQLAGEMLAWKNILQERVAMLRPELYRYQGRTGEQTRAEIVLYERAIERYGAMLVAIAKLNLDARLVGIRQQTMEMLDRALTLAFTSAQVPPEKQAKARETFRKHIKIAS